MIHTCPSGVIYLFYDIGDASTNNLHKWYMATRIRHPMYPSILIFPPRRFASTSPTCVIQQVSTLDGPYVVTMDTHAISGFRTYTRETQSFQTTHSTHIPLPRQNWLTHSSCPGNLAFSAYSELCISIALLSDA